jgi:hypothetical protein
VLSTRANYAISNNIQVGKHFGILQVACSWNIIWAAHIFYEICVDTVDVCMIMDGPSQVLVSIMKPNPIG